MQKLHLPPGIALFALILGALAFFGALDVQAAPSSQEGSPVILAAGDIAKCSSDYDALTSYLLDINEGTILTLGDNAYEVGSLREFEDCFGSTWGRHKDRIYPVPGNHEYGSGDITGYFEYFGDVSTPLEPGCRKGCKGWYSFDIGEWHIVALNSELDNNAGSEQEQWLRADLAAHDNLCTLAYLHRPRYTSRRTEGAAHDLFQALYDYGADVVLAGHDHHYERFGPQDNGKNYEPERGVRQFVVGTGGATLRDIRFIQPNSEVRNVETWGILKMTLHPDSYDWEFIPIPGQTFTDSGSANCVSAPDRPAAPVAETPPAEEAATVQTVAAITPAPAPASAPVAAVTTAGSGEYAIQAGDTLFAIALALGLDWNDLAAANGLTEESLLQIGQILTVPGGAVATSAPATSAVTTTVPSTPTVAASVAAVDEEETALPSGASTAGGAAASAGSDSGAAASSPGDVHIIASGDTIISVALENGLDWQELLDLNGLEEDSLLQVGQEIRLK